MAEIRFDHHPRFAELTEWLRQIAAEHPTLVSLDVLGRSHEGREVWILTVTNTATGPHDEKPAIWLDGNIHASETTASVALVHLLHSLVTGYGTDERITRVLDTRTVLHRAARQPRRRRARARRGAVHRPLDGARLAAHRPGRRPRPRRHRPRRPLAPDARARPERHVEGPRVRPTPARRPRARRGRPRPVLPAATARAGCTATTASPSRSPHRIAGIDSNRNFPYDWERYPGKAPTGAGDFPTSEPEVRAVVQGVIDRPNITAYLAYHTFSGVHLRPFGNKPQDQYPSVDLWTFQDIGRRYTDLTGYPSISILEGFRYDPKSTIGGSGSDWAYDQVGVISWTTEFWNVLKAAGIDDPHPIEWYRNHSLDDELKLLAWCDEHVHDGYVDWYRYDHPELGAVELGGWNHAAVFRNPPPHLLEAEVAPHTDLAIMQALMSPCLRHRETLVEPRATAPGGCAWSSRTPAGCRPR